MRNHPISLDEAKRALYLDFEGPGSSKSAPDPLPLIAGVRCEGQYQATALDPALSTLADRPNVDYMPLDGFLDELLSWAQFEKRRIVFWTSHEKNLFIARGYPPGVIGFDAKIPTRNHSVLRHHFDEFKENTKRYRSSTTAKTTKTALRSKAYGLLTLIAADLGLPRPNGYGPGYVGKWIRSMVEQAKKKDSYDVWSPGVKKATTRLLKHNQHDCEATEFVLHYVLTH